MNPARRHFSRPKISQKLLDFVRKCKPLVCPLISHYFIFGTVVDNGTC